MTALPPDQSDDPLAAEWLEAEWRQVYIRCDGVTHIGRYAVREWRIVVTSGSRHVETWVGPGSNCPGLARVLLTEIVRGAL
jgi:hypothetical protein